MRKVIVLTTICFFSLLLKNENGNCKSKCDVACGKKMKIYAADNMGTDTPGIASEPKQFDGFFFKL